MTGLVAILTTGETGRWTPFWERFVALATFGLPEGADIKAYHGVDIAKARNQALRDCSAGGGDWVWFLDDDHTFPTTVLTQLLGCQADVVQPLVLRRVAPFLPVVQRLDRDHIQVLEDGRVRRPRLVAQTLGDLGPPGLAMVDTCGMGGTLIRRYVWEGLEAPWFRAGEGSTDLLMEDVGFTKRVREAGFTVAVATGIPLGHLVAAEIWPVWNAERQAWETSIRVGGTDLRAPAAARRLTTDATLKMHPVPGA